MCLLCETVLTEQVGRTGSGEPCGSKTQLTSAGKSTLALSLLRISDPSGGRILIDGIDIASISLHALRSRGVTSVRNCCLLCCFESRSFRGRRLGAHLGLCD